MASLAPYKCLTDVHLHVKYVKHWINTNEFRLKAKKVYMYFIFEFKLLQQETHVRAQYVFDYNFEPQVTFCHWISIFHVSTSSFTLNGGIK